MGSPEKIKKIAARIKKTKATGAKLVVIVSAMGDTTDELLSLAKQVTPQFYEREMDMLLTAGERISMALLSMALRDEGVEAISFTGSQAGIITDESHTRAKILEIKPIRVLEELQKNKVVIVAGFQGVSRTKEVTTLGRGGSDTTAIAMAAAIKADACEILTDVAGVFSADPRVVLNAKRYGKLDLTLMLEMAVLGAQVMHPRSIQTAIAAQTSADFQFYVGQAHPTKSAEQEGTFLVKSQSQNSAPTAVCATAVCVRSFEYRELADAEWPLLVSAAEQLKPFTGSLSAISVVGAGIAQQTKVQTTAREALASKNIAIHGLTTAEHSFTIWVSRQEDEKAALQLLHELLIKAN